MVCFALNSGYLMAGQTDRASFDLKGTMWESASEGTGIKPELLYAVSLQESRTMAGSGLAAPDPFVIRYGNDVKRFKSYQEAKTYLDTLTADADINLKRLDIGLMQFNAGWHRHRVEQLSDFLVPGLAIRAAADLLAEISQHTDDPVSWIGRYHSYTPELTIYYGTTVQGIYCRMINSVDLQICGGLYGQK
jgi:hypothetical protein